MPDLIVAPAKNDAYARFKAADAINATADLGLTRGGVPNIPDTNLAPLKEATQEAFQLDVGDLCRMFEESEESTYTARQEAERDRDYVDNKQLTAEELATLKKRGQPPQIDNRIKTKIDYLVGLEKQQRIDPKALPRTPIHEVDADGATQALRYVAETEDYDAKRSGVWRNLMVEGAGAIGVAVKPGSYGNEQGIDITIRRYSWDRIFWDPHSAELDFCDAGYYGTVVWMDYDEALAMYGAEAGAKDALDTTLSSAPSQTYDDKPKWTLWADKKRKRVRIVQIWLKRDEQWHFAEFTKGGILKAGPSPYVTDKGESDCELFFQSAYVDRDNNRYGLVREMITLQDGINKRHSKALHLLNTVHVTSLEGAVDDVEKARREFQRPDGWNVVNRVVDGGVDQQIRVETRLDLAAAQLQLLQEAKNSIDLKGPNATQMGDKTQGSSAASGKAILASQQGGMISLGDLLDNLRHLDRRVFRAVWARIRQYWTEEKWIRVTDDERNIKWVGMNIDPEKMQQLQMQAQQNPEIANKIGGIIASIAELDCDIIIDEVPDVIASQEQFGMLVELKKMDMNGELPFKALVKASSIKDKSKMLEEMEKNEQARAQQPNPEIQAEQAKLQVQQQADQGKLAIAKEKNQIDAEADQRKHELEVARLQAEVGMHQQKLVAELHTHREKINAQVSEKANTERAVNEVKGQEPVVKAVTTAVEKMTEAIAGMNTALTAPRRLIRDKDGKAAGVVIEADARP